MLPGPSSLSSTAPPLKAANGVPITTGAEHAMCLTFATTTTSKRVFCWDFLYGNVDGPIIGNDFLTANSLCVDPANTCVRHLPTGTCFPGVTSFSLGAAAILSADVGQLLSEFPEAAASGSYLPPAVHGVEHHLETTGPPVTAKFRRLDAEKLTAAKSIFADWEKAGIVRRSGSAWASPLHLVRKADNSWRPCGDFRRLNLATTADKYPVPNMNDFGGQIVGCSVFSKLDLKNGYLQIPLHPSAVPKTAIITPFGLFEFIRMPFGLKNAGMSFQRLMDRVLSGLPFVFVYIDDILVASPDRSTHMEHLRAVLQRLQSAGLVLNIDKCVFAQPTVDFLGHRLSAAGSFPLQDKVAAILKHPAPNTVKELQQFLGMVNFYRKFLHNAAKILAPLTDALKGGPPGSGPIQWTDSMQSAFSAAKNALATATHLCHPDQHAELSLVCDASATHVGAALQQRRRGAEDWEPLGFFSKKLDKPQQVYSAFDRELFAAFSAIRHFRYHLEGRAFCLWTDHKPLIFAVKRQDEAWTPRQQRQMSYITEYTGDVRHISGADNIVADTLSRPPVVAPTVSGQLPVSGETCFSPINPSGTAVSLCGALSQFPLGMRSTYVCPGSGTSPPSMASLSPPSGGVPVDLAVLAEAQQDCEETQRLAAAATITLTRLQLEDKTLLCDSSLGSLRPLVPLAHRKTIFSALHGLAHPGIRATRRMISTRWIWKGMSADVAAWCRDCQSCQRGKVTVQPAAPLQQFLVPENKFSHIHVDLVGPLPNSAGHSHLLTVIDRTTRWLEAIPLLSTTATAVADALIAGWIARFGVPANLTSDRGVQFSSEVWAILMSKLGIRHHLTTAYHPQANGMIERSHRQLKDALRSRLAGADWYKHLPWVLFSLRATPKDDSNISSAEMVYGNPLILPGQLPQLLSSPASFSSQLPQFLPVRTPVPPDSTQFCPKELQEAKFVYVRRGAASPPLTPMYSGPFAVVSKNEKYFVIDLGGRSDSVSVDRLKPHLGLAPFSPASAPQRGRPPLSVPPVQDSTCGGVV